MDADVLTTRVVDGIAVITLGTERRIYIDQETSDALFEALSKCAGDPDIRVVIVTGAAPGSFVRHYSIPELNRCARPVVSGQRRDSSMGPFRCARACPNQSLPPFLAHAWPVHSN